MFAYEDTKVQVVKTKNKQNIQYTAVHSHYHTQKQINQYCWLIIQNQTSNGCKEIASKH